MNRRSLLKWISSATASGLLVPAQADRLLFEVTSPVSVNFGYIHVSPWILLDGGGHGDCWEIADDAARYGVTQMYRINHGS